MISTRWRHCAPAVTALIVTVAAAGCAASRPLAETATSAEPAPVATATPLTDDSAQGATLVPTAPPVTPVVTTTLAPSTPSPTAPRPAAGGGAPSSTLGRPTDIEWARVDAYSAGPPARRRRLRLRGGGEHRWRSGPCRVVRRSQLTEHRSSAAGAADGFGRCVDDRNHDDVDDHHDPRGPRAGRRE